MLSILLLTLTQLKISWPKLTFENSLVTAFVHFPSGVLFSYWFINITCQMLFFYHICGKYFFLNVLPFCCSRLSFQSIFSCRFMFNNALKRLSQYFLTVHLFYSNSFTQFKIFIWFLNLIFLLVYDIKWRYLGWEESNLIIFSK